MSKPFYKALTGTVRATAREPVTWVELSLSGPDDRGWLASAMVRERRKRALRDRLGFAPQYVNVAIIVCADGDAEQAVMDLLDLLYVWDWDVVPDLEMRADPHGDPVRTVAAITEFTTLTGWHYDPRENS